MTKFKVGQYVKILLDSFDDYNRVGIVTIIPGQIDSNGYKYKFYHVIPLSENENKFSIGCYLESELLEASNDDIMVEKL